MESQSSPYMVFPGPGEMAEHLASHLREIAKQGVGYVALSGGKTPQPLYRRLAAMEKQLPWERFHLFLVDERYVPTGHPDSNFRMIYESLIQGISIPSENVHPIPIEDQLSSCAIKYEELLRTVILQKQGELPVFDLILLGVGTDGHTASLFPGDRILFEREKLVAPVMNPMVDHHRITLTLPVINAARSVFIIARGREKAGIIQDAISGSRPDLPVSRVSPRGGKSLFLLDEGSSPGTRPNREAGSGER